MTDRRFVLGCFACFVSGAAAMFLQTARAQTEALLPWAGSSYARLHVTGEDALLFTETRILRFAGPKVRQDMPVENAQGVRAVVPHQIIHLNNAARLGYEIVGPVDPDADEFILRRRD